MGLYVVQGFGVSFIEVNYSLDYRCNLYEFVIYVNILYEFYFCFIILYDVLLFFFFDMVFDYEIIKLSCLKLDVLIVIQILFFQKFLFIEII